MRLKKTLSYLFRLLGKKIPDKVYIKILFYIDNGVVLNLKNPTTFQEKIQWLKLYYKNPIYTLMVDKLEVKEYIARQIGSQYVIPTIGVWNNFDEINFDSLPDKFVLKTTHAGGSLGVVICRNKYLLNKQIARKRLTKSLKSDVSKIYREWPYKDVNRKIFAESLLDVPGEQDLIDYKIFCFNGEPKYIQVIKDRNTNETIDFFDTAWVHQPFTGLTKNILQSKTTINKPQNLETMLKIAKNLAKETIFVRVDLYNTHNRIYFGELTFYPAAGSGTFTPKEWNYSLGELIKLPART